MRWITWPGTYSFEARVGASKCRTHLIDQSGVGACEVFVDTVKDFQLEEDFLDAINTASKILEGLARHGR